MAVAFESVGRLPHPNDNVAIATRSLEAGTDIVFRDTEITISHPVLQGHRFAVTTIRQGEALLSWAQPFGLATSDIVPGAYICNPTVLRELRRRRIEFSPPATPNFTDEIKPYIFDEAQFRPTPPLELYSTTKTFMGYRRSAKRGVGTRNTIVLLGTSSLAGGFVNALEARLKPLIEQYPNIDAIVAVAHTEGGHDNPNNRDLLLRTLSGFMVNPNVGAVLAVDYGQESVNNAALLDYLTKYEYPIADVPHRFMSLSKAFEDDLEMAAAVVGEWLDTVNSTPRTPEPVSELKIALQCGGSDAFSGISGNPLAAWVTREILRYGGTANLAETDELIGAEAYMMSNVRDIETARKFLAFQQRFKDWAGWHGHTADGNPSGGNLLRGLYNIYLKSLGASAKRHPDVRLDYVIDYAEPMRETGFYFMDSPGNDLESIAGQIASGCNMIYFVTGNGSITNFPFVPTIKIVTTTERFQLLSEEMDVNAGAYLDNTPMDALGIETFQLTLDIASGQLSAGERAGHSQVQIWRDWRQTSAANSRAVSAPIFSGQPLVINTESEIPDVSFPAFVTERGYASDQVGLILPTSLCSGQIAQLCVQQLNQHHVGRDKGLSRFVTLVHTEGCGSADGHELPDTLLGYLAHPLVKHALLLEHGCERTHNGYIRELMVERSLSPEQFGWASIQLDGGIHKVVHKMVQWFKDQLAADPQPAHINVGLDAVRIAILCEGHIQDELADQLATLTRIIVAGGGAVVIAENDPLLQNPNFLLEVLGQQSPQATLAYAQTTAGAGFHVMSMPSEDWAEKLTGLGAAGIEVMLAHVENHRMSGHPLIPVLQVTCNAHLNEAYRSDLDALLAETPVRWSDYLLDLVISTLARRYNPNVSAAGNTQFQITRGLYGVSL